MTFPRNFLSLTTLVASILLAGCASTATPALTLTATARLADMATATVIVQPSPTVTDIPTSELTATSVPTLMPTRGPGEFPSSFFGPLPDGAVARLGQGSVSGGQISPDGKLAAVGTSTGVLMFDTASLSLVWSVPMLEDAAPEWSHDGSKIATGLADGTVTVLDALTGSELWNLPSDDGYIRELEWTPNDRYLVYSTANSGSMIRDAATGALLHKIVPWEKPDLPYPTHAFMVGTMSPDGAHYLTHIYYQDPGSPDSPAETFAIWDIPSGELNRVIDARDYRPRSLAWAPDSRRVAAETYDIGTMPVWDITTGTITQQLDAFGSRPYWSPDGSKLFANPYYGHGCSVIDIATGKVLFTFDIDGYFVEWSPDSTRLVYYDKGQDKVISLDATNGKIVQPNNQTKYFLRTGSNYPRLAVWDDAAGDFVKTLLVGTPRVQKLVWSSDGNAIDVTYDKNGTIHWDVGSGRPVALGESGVSLAWQNVPAEPRWERSAHSNSHPVAETMLIQTDEICKRYRDSVTVTDPILLSIHDPELDKLGCPTDEATSPNGKTVAVAYNNFLYGVFTFDLYLGERAAVIGIFDAKSMQRLKILRGHASFVTPLAYSPDGSLLATGSSDGTVILWDMTR